MKANKLKGKRIEMGFTQSEMAELIEKSIDAYAKKERGETGFSPTEIAILTLALMLSYSEFNEIFLTADYHSVISAAFRVMAMDKIKLIREFLKEEYGIKNDKELIKALSTCKFIERGFLTNGKNLFCYAPRLLSR